MRDSLVSLARWSDNPLRRLVQPPGRFLAPWIRPGMRVLEAGCATGFFLMPMARLAGPDGQAVGIDCRPGLVRVAAAKAWRAGLAARVDTRVMVPRRPRMPDLEGRMDFALSTGHCRHAREGDFLLPFLAGSLVAGGLLLLAEPAGTVSRLEFETLVARARGTGLSIRDFPDLPGYHGVLLGK